jgi:hypothetical protein
VVNISLGKQVKFNLEVNLNIFFCEPQFPCIQVPIATRND